MLKFIFDKLSFATTEFPFIKLLSIFRSMAGISPNHDLEYFFTIHQIRKLYYKNVIYRNIIHNNNNLTYLLLDIITSL